MSFESYQRPVKNTASIDLQLLVYVLGVAESLLYGLVIVTYIGAVVAFNKSTLRIANEDSEDFEMSKMLEVEAIIQIFGISIFFIVSLVMVSGVKENDHNKLLPYLLLCIVQITVVFIYSIVIWPSWIFIIFSSLKFAMFMFTYALYRKFINDDDEKRACMIIAG